MPGNALDIGYKTEKLNLKSVYYTGSDMLRGGYALCYDRDNVTAEDSQGNQLDATRVSYARYLFVEKPSADNLDYFAGVVHPSCDGKTGPCWITIIEPDNMVVEVWTDQNCTINQTELTLKADSYAFGGAGQGLTKGKALQTVDRSGEAGPVQAWMEMSLYRPTFMTGSPGSTTGPSRKVWIACPLIEMMVNPSVGFQLFDDFVKFPAHSSTADSAVSEYLAGYEAYLYQGAGISPVTDASGGGLVFQSDGDNEGAAIGPNAAPFLITPGGKPFWFEACVELSTAADNKNGVFVGLIESGAVAAGVPIATDGTIADKNILGFHRAEGDGDKWDAVWRADGQNAQSLADEINATTDPIRLGMWFDGETITLYADGEPTNNKISASKIDAATFPKDARLGPCFAIMNATGSSPGNARLYWWRMAQLR